MWCNPLNTELSIGGDSVAPKKENAFSKAKNLFEEIVLYRNNPRSGEYVPYKEIVMLSAGWLAQYFVVQFSCFIINCINRFIVRGQVIDKAIESDMRAEKNKKEQRLAEERRLGVERKKARRKLKTK